MNNNLIEVLRACKVKWKYSRKGNLAKMANDTASFKVGDKVHRTGHKNVHTITQVRVNDTGVIEYYLPQKQQWYASSGIQAEPKVAAKPARFGFRPSGPHKGEGYLTDNAPSPTGKVFRMKITDLEKVVAFMNSL